MLTPMLAVHDTSPASFSARQMISPMCFSALNDLITKVDVVWSVWIEISSLFWTSSPLIYQVRFGFGSPVKTTCNYSMSQRKGRKFWKKGFICLESKKWGLFFKLLHSAQIRRQPLYFTEIECQWNMHKLGSSKCKKGGRGGGASIQAHSSWRTLQTVVCERCSFEDYFWKILLEF